MLVMNVLKATRAILERWHKGDPKIVALTAYPLLGDKKRCLDAGMDAYLSKPVMMDDLAEMLNRYNTEEGPKRIFTLKLVRKSSPQLKAYVCAISFVFLLPVLSSKLQAAGIHLKINIMNRGFLFTKCLGVHLRGWHQFRSKRAQLP
ncbi:MAG: hypothetical protein HPY61_11580 [Methanotrichaceae archaeon]|nr:hypothetical protein [Methanotrichaceae archaeon]